jgi:SAM-dependent methyltransferase
MEFVWHHATRDVTKNLLSAAAVAELEALIGPIFLDAHLFTQDSVAQLEMAKPPGRLRISHRTDESSDGNLAADRRKQRTVEPTSAWLRALGITDQSGKPVSGMTDKFRQIERFAELLSHRLQETQFPNKKTLTVYDMGSGKGYLTFATSAVMGEGADVIGVELRPELVELCNGVAHKLGLDRRLHFRSGKISGTDIGAVDVLLALHACDTATDDALAKGIAAKASLLIVAPCCQKELRPQMTAPEVLKPALRHGIFLERQAEFVTDALRAMLLEWAGYRTKVFEFISTEHTAKNTMITATRAGNPGDETAASRIRDFARFYGVTRQSLATQIGFQL